FPEGAKWMDVMQQKIAEMNKHLGNSCTAAKWAVDGLADTTAGQEVKSFANSVQSSVSLFVADPYEAMTGGADRSTSPQVQQSKNCLTDTQFCIGLGNLVYKSLIGQNVQNWFPSGD